MIDSESSTRKPYRIWARASPPVAAQLGPRVWTPAHLGCFAYWSDFARFGPGNLKHFISNSVGETAAVKIKVIAAFDELDVAAPRKRGPFADRSLSRLANCAQPSEHVAEKIDSCFQMKCVLSTNDNVKLAS